MGESTIRRITEGHARPMFEMFKPQQDWPQQPGCEVMIAQMDGGMVPIVEPDPSREDQRKGKRLHWKEAKIYLAHAQGSLSVTYGETLQGDVDEAGWQLFDCLSRAGFGRTSHLHAVGDGAEWIAAQKERLKSRRAAEGVQALHGHLEAAQVQDAEAPVRRCHRYLSQRLHPLDYQQALACDLPIGSGEIESAHRYVVQQRLKRPCAWWRAANAEHMLALRLNRANRRWNEYWTPNDKLAA